MRSPVYSMTRRPLRYGRVAYVPSPWTWERRTTGSVRARRLAEGTAAQSAIVCGMSRAWFVDRYGGPDRLVLRQRPDPIAGSGEVLVRTAAIGLNFADLFVRSGDYPRTPKPPFVPGMEISGTVEAVGPGVDAVVPGRRVVALPIFGGHAEKVAVPAARVFGLPEGADPIEAAAVAVVFLTAWYACHRAQVGPEDRVVVTAAAGGVGTALLHLLRERGAKVVALVGSEKKTALCRELGAAEA